jgi:hypothetical protein
MVETDTVEKLRTDTVFVETEKVIVLTKSSQALQGEVNKLNDGFKQMTKSGDKSDVLRYFYDKFTSNIVNIGADNAIMVERRTSKFQYGLKIRRLT